MLLMVREEVRGTQREEAGGEEEDATEARETGDQIKGM